MPLMCVCMCSIQTTPHQTKPKMFRLAQRLLRPTAAVAGRVQHGGRNVGMRAPNPQPKPQPQVSTATATATATATGTATATAPFDYRQKLSSAQVIEMEEKYAAHNYHPLPVVWERASGVHVWDPEGKRYYDFLSAYSATNQGHCHPRIVQAMTEQLGKMTLSSRAFYNDAFPRFAKMVSDTFHYESMLPANTGVEAVEGALKMARKWGYEKKRIPAGQALIISACGCFHGRTFGAISMSCDPDAQSGFEPMLPGNMKVAFDDIGALESTLKQHGRNVAAFIVEPIQGEAGVYVPTQGYLKAAAELCKQHNVLFIADEIQTGLGRTGRLLASDYEGVRPDVVLLGKALGGGVYPISAVLADKHIMEVFTAGTHGSTFGGNPLAAAVGMASLEVLTKEGLIDNAYMLGEHLRTQLRAINSPFVKVRIT